MVATRRAVPDGAPAGREEGQGHHTLGHGNKEMNVNLGWVKAPLHTSSPPSSTGFWRSPLFTLFSGNLSLSLLTAGPHYYWYGMKEEGRPCKASPVARYGRAPPQMVQRERDRNARGHMKAITFFAFRRYVLALVRLPASGGGYTSTTSDGGTRQPYSPFLSIMLLPYRYVGLHTISHTQWTHISKLYDSTTKRKPKSIDKFLESSRRHEFHPRHHYCSLRCIATIKISRTLSPARGREA